MITFVKPNLGYSQGRDFIKASTFSDYNVILLKDKNGKRIQHDVFHPLAKKIVTLYLGCLINSKTQEEFCVDDIIKLTDISFNHASFNVPVCTIQYISGGIKPYDEKAAKFVSPSIGCMEDSVDHTINHDQDKLEMIKKCTKECKGR